MRDRVGILVGPKGRGSNMAALAEACRAGAVQADVAIVVAPSPDSPALSIAQSLGLSTAVVPYGDAFSSSLLTAFRGCDWICLAGFMRVVPAEVLRAFGGRVLNIHPALLPKFGGKGMYGRHVHEAVLASGETESGCTVHFVTEVYDEGRVILQLRCPVMEADTVEALADRVLSLEHLAYPRALQCAIEEQRAGS